MKGYFGILFIILSALKTMLGAFLQLTCFAESTIAKLDRQSLNVMFEATALPESAREQLVCGGFANLSYIVTLNVGGCEYSSHLQNYQIGKKISFITSKPASCTNTAGIIAAKAVSFYTQFEGVDGRFEGNTEVFEKQIFDYTQCILNPSLRYGNNGIGSGFVYVSGTSTDCKLDFSNVSLTLSLASTNGSITLKRAAVSVTGFTPTGPNVPGTSWSILDRDGALHFNCTDFLPASPTDYEKCLYTIRAIGTVGVFYSQVVITSTRLVNTKRVTQQITAVVTEASMAQNTYECHLSATLTIDGTFYRIQLNRDPAISYCLARDNGTLGLFAFVFLVRNQAVPGSSPVFKIRRNLTDFNPNTQTEVLSNCKSDNFPAECVADNYFDFLENKTQRLSIFACLEADCFTPNITIAPFTIVYKCHEKARGLLYNDRICVQVNSTCNSVSTMLQFALYSDDLKQTLFETETMGQFPNIASEYCFTADTIKFDVQRIVGLMRIDDYVVAVETFEDFASSPIKFAWAGIAGCTAVALVYYAVVYFKGSV